MIGLPLPGGPDPALPIVLALGGVALLAGLVRGFSGFGAGLVMAPAFSVLIGPADGVPLMILLELVATGRLLPGVLPEVRARTVLTPGVTACLLVPVGALGLAFLDGALLTRFISLAVLAFVALFASGWRSPRPPGTPALLGVGAASGLLTGVAGIGGPPMVVMVLSGPDSAARNRANLIAYFGLTQTVALAIFALQGMLSWAQVGFGLVLGVPFLAGIQLGARLFRAAGERSYRGVVLALLTAIALVGLVSVG